MYLLYCPFQGKRRNKQFQGKRGTSSNTHLRLGHMQTLRHTNTLFSNLRTCFQAKSLFQNMLKMQYFLKKIENYQVLGSEMQRVSVQRQSETQKVSVQRVWDPEGPILSPNRKQPSQPKSKQFLQRECVQGN